MIEKIMKHKKSFSAVLLLCLIAVFVSASGETNAWFTDTKERNQHMQVGKLKINLVIPKQANTVSPIEPGATYGLSSGVKNAGTLDGQLRVKIIPKYIFEELFEPNYFYESNLPTENAIFNFTSEFMNDFTLNEDGYYYYNNIFNKGQEIQIFDSITMDGATTGNEYQPDDKNVYFAYKIIAETRQIPSSVRGNTSKNGVNVTYNISDDIVWESVENNIEINGQNINTTAPTPFEVLSFERVGNQIEITFNKNIENFDYILSSDGPVKFIDTPATRSGNTIIGNITELALSTPATYTMYLENYNASEIIAEKTFIIE